VNNFKKFSTDSQALRAAAPVASAPAVQPAGAAVPAKASQPEPTRVATPAAEPAAVTTCAQGTPAESLLPHEGPLPAPPPAPQLQVTATVAELERSGSGSGSGTVGEPGEGAAQDAPANPTSTPADQGVALAPAAGLATAQPGVAKSPPVALPVPATVRSTQPASSSVTAPGCLVPLMEIEPGRMFQISKEKDAGSLTPAESASEEHTQLVMIDSAVDENWISVLPLDNQGAHVESIEDNKFTVHMRKFIRLVVADIGLAQEISNGEKPLPNYSF